MNSTTTSMEDDITSAEDGPYIWNEPTQGLILGSYYWGFIVTQIPGGRLAELKGGKWVFWMSVMINILGTFFTPICTYSGIPYLIMARVIMGLAGGVCMPAMSVLITKWCPELERAYLTGIIYTGTTIGTVVSMTTAGILAKFLTWEAIFYVHGGLATVWLILWGIFISDSPATNNFISETESIYIANNCAGNNEDARNAMSVPWKSIFTSIPFWSLTILHFTDNFAFYIYITELPLFMKTGLGFSISENTLLSSAPFLGNVIFLTAYSKLLDVLESRKIIGKYYVRRISIFICSFLSGILLISICLVGCNIIAIIVIMIINVAVCSTAVPGVFANHSDLAPNFSGVLMGITNMFATIPGFMVPSLVGALTEGKSGLEPWHTLFYITAGLLIASFIIFMIFGSTNEQSWNTQSILVKNVNAIMEQSIRNQHHERTDVSLGQLNMGYK